MENRPPASLAHRPAPATGMKRSSTSGTLSAQTRSMSKLNPTANHLERLQDGKTVFGGLRRKRAPLMDALVNAASEEERPRKIARPSATTTPSSVAAKTRPRIKARTIPHPAQPATPRSPFSIGTRIVSASEISPAHSDSSEDSLLLQPTPRKQAQAASSSLRVEVDVYREIKPIRSERILFAQPEPARARRSPEDVEMGSGTGSSCEVTTDQAEAMEIDGADDTFGSTVLAAPTARLDTAAAPSRPRVLGSTTSASRPTISSLPRPSSSRGFAAPTLASQTKHVRTESAHLKRSSADVMGGTNRLTAPTASSLAKAVERSKISAPPALASAARASLGLGQVKRVGGAGQVSRMDLAAIAEGSATPGKYGEKAGRAEKQAAMLGLGLSGVSRPSSLARSSGPSQVGTASASSSMDPPAPQPRRPSYPSSLGSGPLAHPVPRVVSNPHVSKAPFSFGVERPTNRSVSDPLSKSQRAGLSANSETAKSMHDLSAALAKLRFKKQQQQQAGVKTRVDADATAVPPVSPGKWLTAARLAKASATSSEAAAMAERTQLRHSVGPGYLASHASARVSVGGSSTGDASFSSNSATKPSIASLLESSAGVGALKGVTAFVDVRTEDGVDSGGMFIQLLRGCGARVRDDRS